MKTKYFLFIFFLLVSCKLPISSKQYDILPKYDNKIINIKTNNNKNDIIKYKYCDNVLLYLIPTGLKNKNVNFVSNKALENYNKNHNTNYKNIYNVKAKRFVYHYPPIFYKVCMNVEGKIIIE